MTEMNTIECVADIQGKITYDENNPISKSDLDTRLINVLTSINDVKNNHGLMNLVASSWHS